MRNRFPRSFYIPEGAMKVADRHSDAVAYLYDTNGGDPACVMFYGKADKPAFRYRYRTAKAREDAIARAFDARRGRVKMVQDRRNERKAWVPPYKVGDIFRTCWGYDQTNVEFFELVALRGKLGVLRELKQERISEGWAQGKCVPLPGEYVGEPIRRRCQPHGFKISSYQIARPADVETVAGVRVVKPASWTAYA